MGIRPQFHIIVGIDDAKPDDPRRSPVKENWLEDILYHRKLSASECWSSEDIFNDYKDTNRELYDMLYNPELSDEYALGNVIGYQIYAGKYDDQVIRAMAAIDEKYLHPGWERIPLLDPEDHTLMYSRYGYTDEDFQANRFVTSVFENMPQISRYNWQKAQHYLKLVGWDIPETDLRYMLVWSWC